MTSHLSAGSDPERQAIAIFDIDGTLTDTMDVDVECYEAAVRAEVGVEIPSDWPTFDEVTDAAILSTACERAGVPVPGRRAQERIATRVGELLAVELSRKPERFRAIPGAADVFELLRQAGWRVGIATGAWRPSALVKLEGARIPHEGVPLASASDHSARADIIRHAVETLGARDGEPVVYVGDGVWDGRAAKSLGYGFVGVASGQRCGELLDVGADSVISDFADSTTVLEQLARLR